MEIIDLTNDDSPTPLIIDLTHDNDESNNTQRQHVSTTPRPSYRVSLTYASGQIGPHIRLRDLIQATAIHMAVLSSMIWDDRWLCSQVFPNTIRQIRVVDEHYQQNLASLSEFCITPLAPRQRNHAKYMLLFGHQQLRLIICTANLTPLEWGESINSMLENVVLWVDLVRELGSAPPQRTPFMQEMRYFLQHQGLPIHVLRAFSGYSDTPTSSMRFVYSL